MKSAQRRWYRFWLVALAVLVTAGAAGRADAAPPQRIVSVNVCTDQLLLRLVPRKRIAALSYLAVDPTLSNAYEEAKGLPLVVGATEEVLAHDADLVLAQEYSTTATVGLLRQIGRRVVMVPLAQSFEGIRLAIRTIATAVEEPERGEALVAEFDRRLKAVTASPAKRPTALAYQVNSLASGSGTLLDEVITAAGFRNLALELPLGPAGRLPLETLVEHPPDLIVLGNTAREFHSIVGDNLRHPAFRKILGSRPSIELPMARWLCGTPDIVNAVEALALARERLASDAAATGVGKAALAAPADMRAAGAAAQ